MGSFFVLFLPTCQIQSASFKLEVLPLKGRQILNPIREFLESKSKQVIEDDVSMKDIVLAVTAVMDVLTEQQGSDVSELMVRMRCLFVSTGAPSRWLVMCALAYACTAVWLCLGICVPFA